MVGFVALVPGLEIKYFSFSAHIRYAAAEYFSALKPTRKDDFVGLGNIEILAIHFFVRDFDPIGQPCRDRMIGSRHPKPLTLVYLTPAQSTTRSHQFTEGFRHMRGMQEYAAHAAQNARGDLIHERVAHGFMHTMPPPDKHVRFLQNFIREPAAVFVIVLIHRFRFESFAFE